MATKPKKTTPKKKAPIKKTSSKRVTSNKKAPAKRRSKKSSKNTSNFKRNSLVFLSLVFMVLLIAFGYFWGQKSNLATKDKVVVHKEKKQEKKRVVKKVENKRVVKKPVAKAKKEPRVVKKEALKKVQIVKEKVVQIKKTNASNRKNLALAYRGKRAKLVIIIDDVHTKTQINAIKALHMKVTPSIFPPYKLAANSHLLARGLKHYMVHLPMESSNIKFNRQYKTLKTSFSKKRIQARVKEIRMLFPTAKYINNHTGSVFTADYRSMYILYKALRQEGFVFIDSMTTGFSKVKQIAHDFGDAYVARDTFIDNEHTVSAIHKQLRQAVKLAKKNGYAIVIGHPHPTTIKALGSAKNIFKGIDLVYIDEIYR
jgi:polysaccharide deacetylase 2 family uncharacterized protein YibQ